MSPIPVAPLGSGPRARGPGHGRLLDGLLSRAGRKNGWQLAKVNGDADLYGIHYLLNRARWSVAEARTALCGYVQAHLGDPQVVGIIDETAFLKKGTHSAGVARQYSGTAGQVENCQVGFFLAYAGARGYTLLDAELYLPQGWTREPAHATFLVGWYERAKPCRVRVRAGAGAASTSLRRPDGLNP